MIPIKDKILLKKDPKVEKIGLIDLPKEAQAESLFGTVAAIGSAVRDVQVGQRVVIGKVDGLAIPNSAVGEEGQFVMVRESQVRAILG